MLTSCARPRPAILVSPVLLEPTETPKKPQGEYMQDAAAVYVLGLKKSVASCNSDKVAISKVVEP